MSRTLGSVIAGIWYLTGLVLLFQKAFYVWFVFGIFIPVIPFVYSIIFFLDKYMK
jgi:hypothetical protein